MAKRCENIRDHYVRLDVPGLRGPRALDQLALLLISTGELTTEDLRRLPAETSGRLVSLHRSGAAIGPQDGLDPSGGAIGCVQWCGTGSAVCLSFSHPARSGSR
jgi:hypothetical protein